MIQTIVKEKEKIKHLALREIKARYKQSFLGVIWIVINPLAQMIILSFVFSKLMRFTDLGVPYPVFIYSGLIPWVFFSVALSSSMDTLTGNASLIKKLGFPREILVLSTVSAKVIDLLLSLVVFFVLMLLFKVPITPFVFIFIPIFIIQFVFTYGLALLLSAVNLFYRDIQYLFNLVILLWFYLTPVIYPVELFPQHWRWIFKLNPMSVFINAYRQVLLNGDWPQFSSLAVAVFISIVVYVVAYKIFKRLEGTFADVV